MLEDYWGEDIDSVKNIGRKSRTTKDNKKDRQNELDFLLDKIGKSGLESLTREEKNRLDELTREI